MNVKYGKFDKYSSNKVFYIEYFYFLLCQIWLYQNRRKIIWSSDYLIQKPKGMS